jgi:acyl-CoA thioester hydrolase
MARMHVPTRLRWSDLDAYGHVNNAEMLRLLEEARIQAFWATEHAGEDQGTAILDARPGSATVTVIARQEVEYLAPIPYLRQPLDIQLWLGRLGGSSIEVCYEVCSPLGVDPFVMYTRAATTIVLLDSETMRPRRLTAEERTVWTPYLEDPIAFTKRN